MMKDNRSGIVMNVGNNVHLDGGRGGRSTPSAGGAEMKYEPFPKPQMGPGGPSTERMPAMGEKQMHANRKLMAEGRPQGMGTMREADSKTDALYRQRRGMMD